MLNEPVHCIQHGTFGRQTPHSPFQKGARQRNCRRPYTSCRAENACRDLYRFTISPGAALIAAQKARSARTPAPRNPPNWPMTGNHIFMPALSCEFTQALRRKICKIKLHRQAAPYTHADSRRPMEFWRVRTVRLYAGLIKYLPWRTALQAVRGGT